MLLSNRSIGILVTVAVAALAAAKSAEAEESDGASRLVGLGANFLSLAPFTPGQLLEIDPITGTTSPQGPGYQLEIDRIGLNLAADSRGQLFNLFSQSNPDAAIPPKLHQLDPLDGRVVRSLPLVFGTDDPYLVYATAFDSGDRLHAIALNSAPNVDAIPALIQIDAATGQVDFGPPVDTLDYTGLAFDADDNLFAVAAGAGLVALDAATGETHVLGGDLASADFANASPSLAFSADGELYATSDRLLLVDPATGTTKAIGDGSLLPWTIVGLDFAVPIQSSDFDLDGDVDGDDFLSWQSGFGINTGARHMDGDADTDGDVDGDDFLLWQNQFDNRAPGTGAAVAVPEPVSPVLVILGGIAITLLPRRLQSW